MYYNCQEMLLCHPDIQSHNSHLTLINTESNKC